MQAYDGIEPFVFISYAHADRDRVLPILEVLGRVGLRLWYDVDIYSGDEWPGKIEQRLTDCDRLLAFISAAYIESRNCRDEIGLALNEGKPVHLVRLDDAPFAHGLKLRLSTLNYLTYDGDTDALVTSLMADDELESCKGRPRTSHQFWRPPHTWFGQWQTEEERATVTERLGEPWGPERPTFTDGAYPERWAINARTDHPSYGDLRRFVRIRKKGTARWLAEATLEPGCTYEVRLAYSVDGDPHENASGRAIADKVKASVYVPERVFPQQRGVVRGALHAAWPQPGPLAPDDELWATVSVYVRDQPVFLSFVPASCHINNQGKLNGKVMSTALFGEDGIFLGFNKISGTIPSGETYAGDITFELRAWTHQGDCAVRRIARVGEDEFATGRLDVAAGETVTFRTDFANESDTDLTNVTFRDQLPGGLAVVPGTVWLQPSAGTARTLSDEIAGRGINTGLYGSGVTAQISYEVRVPASELPRNYYTRSDVFHDGGRRYSSLLVHAAGSAEVDPRVVTDPEHDPRYAAWLAESDRGGWGPRREMFTMKVPARRAVFNSISDNNVLGDERNFVRVAEHGAHGTFCNRMQVVPGHIYEVYIWYDNSASPGIGEAGVAHGVRVSAQFPSRIEPLTTARVSAIVHADDTDPTEVWSHSVFWSTEPVVLRCVPESARLYNGRHKGLPLNELDLFGRDGALVGADALDGVISSADRDASGHVSYLLAVEEG